MVTNFNYARPLRISKGCLLLIYLQVNGRKLVSRTYKYGGHDKRTQSLIKLIYTTLYLLLSMITTNETGTLVPYFNYTRTLTIPKGYLNWFIAKSMNENKILVPINTEIVKLDHYIKWIDKETSMEDQKMKLHCGFIFSNWTAMFGLHEKSLDFELVFVDWVAGEARTKTFLSNLNVQLSKLSLKWMYLCYFLIYHLWLHIFLFVWLSSSAIWSSPGSWRRGS